MINNQLFYSLTEPSLFDTYLLYGIIGLLIFIALVGLVVLVITSCCCFYSIPWCSCCCYHRQRHSSYKLNENSKEQQDMKKILFMKRHSSDITDFSQLYNSNPHLINSKSMITTGITNRNLDASCTTLNSLFTPISPCSSFRSFIESVPLVRNNLNNLSQPHITKGKGSQTFAHPKNPPQIPRRFTLQDRSISSIDMTNNAQTNSSCTNIYDTVIPITNVNPSPDRSTPIYETEWTHNYKQLMMNKIPSIEKNAISVIQLPSTTQPDLLPSLHYFQQQHHPYDKFLANRTQSSDSTRRANMLKQINDDAAFLY